MELPTLSLLAIEFLQIWRYGFSVSVIERLDSAEEYSGRTEASKYFILWPLNFEPQIVEVVILEKSMCPKDEWIILFCISKRCSRTLDTKFLMRQSQAPLCDKQLRCFLYIQLHRRFYCRIKAWYGNLWSTLLATKTTNFTTAVRLLVCPTRFLTGFVGERISSRFSS